MPMAEIRIQLSNIHVLFARLENQREVYAKRSIVSRVRRPVLQVHSPIAFARVFPKDLSLLVKTKWDQLGVNLREQRLAPPIRAAGILQNRRGWIHMSPQRKPTH